MLNTFVAVQMWQLGSVKVVILWSSLTSSLSVSVYPSFDQFLCILTPNISLWAGIGWCSGPLLIFWSPLVSLWPLICLLWPIKNSPLFAEFVRSLAYFLLLCSYFSPTSSIILFLLLQAILFNTSYIKSGDRIAILANYGIRIPLF